MRDIGASSTGSRAPSWPQRVHPGDFGKQPHDLPQAEHDAHGEHAEDQAVEARVGHVGGGDLAIQDQGDEARQDQEDHHPHEIDARR
jgi:hypothetical protein